jgi:drug/metabolite transporter (DMT)-like permease
MATTCAPWPRTGSRRLAWSCARDPVDRRHIIVLYGWTDDVPAVTAAPVSRVAALPAVAAVAWGTRSARLQHRWRHGAVLAGLFACGALLALALAVQVGPVSVAAVAGSQFATFTSLAGLVLLREWPRRCQAVGILVALTAVTLLSTGARA